MDRVRLVAQMPILSMPRTMPPPFRFSAIGSRSCKTNGKLFGTRTSERCRKRKGEAENAAFSRGLLIADAGDAHARSEPARYLWLRDAAGDAPAAKAGRRLLRLTAGRRSVPIAAALCAQSLGWIDAIGAPEELCKPARGTEAMTRRNPGNRFSTARAQQLGPGRLEPDPPQGGHWRRAAESPKGHLQSADAAARNLCDLDNRQRRAGIGAHEFLSPLDIGRGCGCSLLLQTLGVAMPQSQQQVERQVILKAARRDRVCQQ